MARIRTIKPEFFTNERLSALPESVHLAAAGLLTYADDFGYFNANPGLIKAAISPLREPLVNIPEALRRLQTIGFLTIAKAPDGREYGWIVEFTTHQRVSHPTPSKIKDLCRFPDRLRSSPDNFRPEQGTGNREQGKEEEKEKTAQSSSSSVPMVHAEHRELVLSPAVIDLPLNTGKPYEIRQPLIDEWAQLYPAVDVLQALRSMRGWLGANPKKRKTASGVKRFVVAWLSREQDKGPRKAGAPVPTLAAGQYD